MNRFWCLEVFLSTPAQMCHSGASQPGTYGLEGPCNHKLEKHCHNKILLWFLWWWGCLSGV